MPHFSRRRFIGAGLGALSTAALAACATPGTHSVNTAPVIPTVQKNEPVRLTYWAWLKDFQNVVDIWNAKNPQIQVEVEWIPGGNSGGYSKMYAALAAGGGPDLGQIELRTIPEFILVNGLVDLNRYGANDYADRYDPTLWGQVSFAGGVYGIPQDSGPIVTYYQPALYDKVGAAPPKTWDEWYEVGKELRKAKSYIDCFPLNDGTAFTSFAAQAGAAWFRAEEDGWVINMTDDTTMNVARFFDKAINDDVVNTAISYYSPSWFAAAAKGELASWTIGSWGDAIIEGVSGGEGKWMASPMPRWGDSGFGSSYNGGSTAAVLANSKHPREALEFAVWLTTSHEGIDAMIKYSGIGWSPDKTYIGASRDQPSKFFSGQNYGEQVIVPASREQNPKWSWWPVTQQTFNILGDYFRKKPTGLSLPDAVAQTQDKVIEVFKNKGLNIRKESA